MQGWSRTCALLLLVATGSACSTIGASEITITARNDSENEMLVGVIGGDDADAPPYGDSYSVAPGEEAVLTLGVPGGGWAVTVNGRRMVGRSDAGERRGELPVTVILPDAAEFALGPYWEAPVGWGIVSDP